MKRFYISKKRVFTIAKPLKSSGLSASKWYNYQMKKFWKLSAVLTIAVVAGASILFSAHPAGEDLRVSVLRPNTGNEEYMLVSEIKSELLENSAISTQMARKILEAISAIEGFDSSDDILVTKKIILENLDLSLPSDYVKMIEGALDRIVKKSSWQDEIEVTNK